MALEQETQKVLCCYLTGFMLEYPFPPCSQLNRSAEQGHANIGEF